MSDLGNRAIMGSNIQRFMERKGKTRAEVCEDLGLKYTTFADWVNGKTYPRIDKIELMADYFGVSKSELVERPVDETTAGTSKTAPRIPRQVAKIARNEGMNPDGKLEYKQLCQLIELSYRERLEVAYSKLNLMGREKLVELAEGLTKDHRLQRDPQFPYTFPLEDDVPEE